MRRRHTFAIASSALVGCAWVADIGEFHGGLTGVDGGAIDATTPPDFLPSLPSEPSLMRVETLDGGNASDASVASDACASFLCGSYCVDAADPTYGCSPANACRSCPTGPHAKTSCAAGKCSFQCTVGYADCNADTSDGCEVDLANSAQHCGSCATNCLALAFAGHAVFTCDAGACVPHCKNGYVDCDEQAANGCECNLQTQNCLGGSCVSCKGKGAACQSNDECCGATTNATECRLDPIGTQSYCSLRAN